MTRAATKFRDLLPSDVVVLEATDEMWDEPLTGVESRFVENAVPRRRREFQAGRAAARVALRRVGIDSWDLVPDDGRRPQWPVGIVGSITHCRRYCAVAVARRSRYFAVGIDAEEAEPLPSQLVSMVCTDRERQWLRGSGSQAGLYAKVIFSAKEAFYKSYSPATGGFLEFTDVDIRLDLAKRSFAAECRSVRGDRAERFRHCTGRFAVDHGLVVAALALEEVGEISS